MREGLAEARITGFDPERLALLTDELLAANGLVEAFIYWQITRGTPPWESGIQRPRVTKQRLTPTVVGFACAVPAVKTFEDPEVKRVALRPDTRWSRGRLKSISLLGGVLAAFEAEEAGADDAIMTRGELITEGTATNVFLYADGRFLTPSLDSAPMLAGVTRQLLIEENPTIDQRPVRAAELLEADEVMLVGTRTMVASVTHVDGKPIGGGQPGPRSRELLATLRRAIRRDVER
ncbi:MAG: aminotransferase class IV, partial [Phycisphaerae bacterium]|nr:aminotransferase class IV [Phycisphaerae bacterium]